MQDSSPGISFQVSVQHKQVGNLHTCGSRCLLIAEGKLCSQKEFLDLTL
jgi:translation initiation factor 6 (eIF-6)